MWDVQTDGEQQQETEQKPQPVWITDSKNNIKYAITHLNYSQVNNSSFSKKICLFFNFKPSQNCLELLTTVVFNAGSRYVYATISIFGQFEQRRENDDHYQCCRSGRSDNSRSVRQLRERCLHCKYRYKGR